MPENQIKNPIVLQRIQGVLPKKKKTCKKEQPRNKISQQATMLNISLTPFQERFQPLHQRSCQVPFCPGPFGKVSALKVKELFSELHQITLAAAPWTPGRIVLEQVLQSCRQGIPSNQLQNQGKSAGHKIAAFTQMPAMPRVKLEEALREGPVMRAQ